MQIHSFASVSAPDAEILILGSMPGRASLAAKEYYAHPRNAFWKIVEALFDIRANEDYHERLRRLAARRVALWDVLKTCTRESSLDSDIVESSIVANDFAAFFAAHPKISRVCFNGARAEGSFLKHARPTIIETRGDLEYQRLPSTSPANATLSLAAKISAWQSIVR